MVYILSHFPNQNGAKCLRWIKLCDRPHSQLNLKKINKDVYICSKGRRVQSCIIYSTCHFAARTMLVLDIVICNRDDRKMRVLPLAL